jgi:hypothetical protein
MMQTIEFRASLLAVLLCVAACDGGTGTPTGASTDAPVEISNREWDDHVIHFNAFTTDQLAAEVASKYGIVRSKSRAMLNVTILRKQSDGTQKAVHAKVVAQVSNLANQVKDLTLREIAEQDAIYYVGDTPVANGETLVFDIQATPEDGTPSPRVRFQRHFSY